MCFKRIKQNCKLIWDEKIDFSSVCSIFLLCSLKFYRKHLNKYCCVDVKFHRSLRRVLSLWYPNLGINFNFAFALVCSTTLCDWLAKLAPFSRPMRSKTKTNRDLFARVFPRLAPVTRVCFEFWLVHCAVCVCCDWSDHFGLGLRHSVANRPIVRKDTSLEIGSHWVPVSNLNVNIWNIYLNCGWKIK